MHMVRCVVGDLPSTLTKFGAGKVPRTPVFALSVPTDLNYDVGDTRKALRSGIILDRRANQRGAIGPGRRLLVVLYLSSPEASFSSAGASSVADSSPAASASESTAAPKYFSVSMSLPAVSVTFAARMISARAFERRTSA